jgi:zinc transporter ZupT
LQLLQIIVGYNKKYMITVLLISIGAFVATGLGGVFAIRAKDKLHLILGFSAGALLGAALFDLLPESFGIGSHYYSYSTMFALLAVGIFGYLLVDRFLVKHSHSDEADHAHDTVSHTGIGPLSLVIHSLFDGIAIGLASFIPAALPVVAIAVIVHDFSDGINTVNLVFRNSTKDRKAWMWLSFDALAPIVGAVTTRLFIIPDQVISIILIVLSGFFVYIGASDLIPESYHGHPTKWTTIMTVVGAAVILAAVKLAGI